MPNMLLIEDDESNRITLSALLEDEGFVVTEAVSCATARACIAAPDAIFDLVLTDLHLGDGLGTDLMPAVRQRFPRAKIVLISGSARPEDMPSGMDALVPKGTEFSATLKVLRELLTGGA